MASDAGGDLVESFVQAATGELPVIMQLPMERSAELAAPAIQAGATVISLAAPRGILPASDGKLVQGRLYGPALFPQALKAVQELVQLGIPTVGAGGIYTQGQTEAMLAVGAAAVQLDAVLWREAGIRILT
jgi:dihydroorotate dehydrogenase